ncbi:MAG: bacteriohemerythrin [Bdellovibrio sp.]|nr:bacteriohemerythrin [Bdellovibrio sp.]
MSRKFVFEWDPESLELGVEAMDKDHQKLILLMNNIFQLYSKHASRDQISHSLDELGKFVVEHFAREERYFDSVASYPDADIHKSIHKKLVNKYVSFVNSYKEGGELTEDFFFFLKAWLVAHIEGVDAKYAS